MGMGLHYGSALVFLCGDGFLDLSPYSKHLFRTSAKLLCELGADFICIQEMEGRFLLCVKFI